MIEGTNIEPDIEEGIVVIKIKNTTARELARLCNNIEIIFSQGVMNIRNGKAEMHFDGAGILKGVDMNVSKWREGKEVINRVALYEEAKVEIIGKQ